MYGASIFAFSDVDLVEAVDELLALRAASLLGLCDCSGTLPLAASGRR